MSLFKKKHPVPEETHLLPENPDLATIYKNVAHKIYERYQELEAKRPDTPLWILDCCSFTCIHSYEAFKCQITIADIQKVINRTALFLDFTIFYRENNSVYAAQSASFSKEFRFSTFTGFTAELFPVLDQIWDQFLTETHKSAAAVSPDIPLDDIILMYSNIKE